MLKRQILIFGLALIMMAGQTHAAKASGPLRVHPTNPRYFTDGSGRAVYLTGSHHWNNLQDSERLGKPLTKRFDYDGYLELLTRLHHNFMRMWAWEGGENEEYYAPIAYSRAGPGTALDSKPKFDLNQFNPEYFERLRSRVITAGNRGIYVSVMLFQGWSIYTPGTEIRGRCIPSTRRTTSTGSMEILIKMERAKRSIHSRCRPSPDCRRRMFARSSTPSTTWTTCSTRLPTRPPSSPETGSIT